MVQSYGKYLFSLITSSWILCLDQATKIYIHTQVPKPYNKSIIEGFFNLTYVTNSGGAFGLLNQGPELLRQFLFLVIPIFCMMIICVMIKKSFHRLEILALSFVLGGAFGNYIDRLRLGYVVDFIDWHFKGWHYPTFNLADSFIVTGVAILCVIYIQDYKNKAKASSE